MFVICCVHVCLCMSVRTYMSVYMHVIFACACCATVSVCNVLWAYVFAYVCCFVYVHAFACNILLSPKFSLSKVSFMCSDSRGN